MKENPVPWQVYVIALAVLVLGVGYLVLKDFSLFKGVPSDFKISSDTMANDLSGKSVTLPQGQLWGFGLDQNLSVKIISKKDVDGVVVVTAELSALVHFSPPPKDDKDKSKQPPKEEPKQAKLSGLAKLYYEQVGQSWYLVHVEGISLKVAAE